MQYMACLPWWRRAARVHSVADRDHTPLCPRFDDSLDDVKEATAECASRTAHAQESAQVWPKAASRKCLRRRSSGLICSDCVLGTHVVQRRAQRPRVRIHSEPCMLLEQLMNVSGEQSVYQGTHCGKRCHQRLHRSCCVTVLCDDLRLLELRTVASLEAVTQVCQSIMTPQWSQTSHPQAHLRSAGSYCDKPVTVALIGTIPPGSTLVSSPARAALSAARLLTAVRMRHPHVTTVYAARLRPPHMDALTAHAWLTHDWCAGGSLRNASEKGLLCAPCVKAPLAPLLALLRGMAEGLAAMHAARLTLTAPLWDCVLLQVCSVCVLGLRARQRAQCMHHPAASARGADTVTCALRIAARAGLACNDIAGCWMTLASC